MSFALRLTAGLVTAAAAAVVLFQAERPPMDSIQRGYRGTGMDEIYNPRLLAKQVAANQIPATLPFLGDAGPKAGTIYKNVKVLNDVSVGEFTRLMASVTTWVAPTQGCAYCHDTNDMASDALYTKIVSRRMFQMVRHINGDWKTHVAATGVTCYTCHRGQPVPPNVWFNDPGQAQAGGFAQTPAGKNHPALAAGATSLPFDPYTPFLEQNNEIRVVSQTALPTGDRTSDLCADDEFLPVAGRQLHVLPQHAVVHGLGPKLTAARDGVVRHSDGARPEHELPGSAAHGVSESASGR